jgi:hypothetical protein
VAQRLQQHGIATAADIQKLSAAALQSLCGLSGAMAAQLWEYGGGRDSQLPTVRPPPKTLSVQTSLTPVPIAMHPSCAGRAVATGDSNGMLQPLMVHGRDTHEGMMLLLSQMLRDMLARVQQDRYGLEPRWAAVHSHSSLHLRPAGLCHTRYHSRCTSGTVSKIKAEQGGCHVGLCCHVCAMFCWQMLRHAKQLAAKQRADGPPDCY